MSIHLTWRWAKYTTMWQLFTLQKVIFYRPQNMGQLNVHVDLLNTNSAPPTAIPEWGSAQWSSVLYRVHLVPHYPSLFSPTNSTVSSRPSILSTETIFPDTINLIMLKIWTFQSSWINTRSHNYKLHKQRLLNSSEWL